MHAVEARDVVAERRDARNDWGLVGVSGEIGEAAEAMREMREAGPAAIGAGLPVAGYAQHDQARIGCGELLPAEAPFLHRAGAEVLDENVRLRDQLDEEFDALGATQIDRDRLLVARFRQPRECRVVALGRGAEAAHRIAADGVLDLEHLGAVFAHDRGCVRSREKGADVDDANARERQRFGRVVVRGPEPADVVRLRRSAVRRVLFGRCHCGVLPVLRSRPSTSNTHDRRRRGML